MELQPTVVSGWVGDDGILHVAAKVGLPPGPVSVTVEAAKLSVREDTRRALEAIWAQRKARGVRPRAKEEIDAEIDAIRDSDVLG